MEESFPHSFGETHEEYGIGKSLSRITNALGVVVSGGWEGAHVNIAANRMVPSSTSSREHAPLSYWYVLYITKMIVHINSLSESSHLIVWNSAPPTPTQLHPPQLIPTHPNSAPPTPSSQAPVAYPAMLLGNSAPSKNNFKLIKKTHVHNIPLQ